MRTRLGVWIAGLALLLATSSSAGEELTATIEVRDGATRTPLAGATVYSVSKEALRNVRQPWRFDHGDMLELARRVGTRTTTDEAGIARVSASLFKYDWFVVEHEGRFGAESWYDPDQEQPHRIDVFPDVSVRVKLLLADGLPAPKMPLSMRRPSDDMYPWIWQGVTNAKGEATVTHVRWRLDRIPATQGRLVAEIPGVERSALVPMPTGETPVVTLQLPPLGHVRVEPTGAGAAGRVLVKLREDPTRKWQPTVEERMAAGELETVIHVGLGRRYRVDVHPFDPLFRDAETVVADGPSDPGGGVLVRPLLDRRNALVQLRIVDEEGNPICNEQLHVRATYPTSNTSSSTTTDAEGRVLIKLNFGGLFGGDEAGRAKPVHLELVPRERSMSGDARIELDVSPPHEDGVRDLGDVVLPSVPVVLSGTVVDDLGQPVPEVYVFVNQGRSVRADEQGTTWFNPRPRASDEVEEKVTYSWSPRARAITDVTGHFVMRGYVEEGLPSRFSIHKPGYALAASQPVRPGAKDERLILERTGRLVGGFKLGPRLDPRAIQLRLRGRPAAGDAVSPTSWGSEEPPPDDQGTRYFMPGWQTADGVYIPAEDGVQPFQLNDLRPGVASLDVMFGDDPDPALTLPDIVIRPGETIRLPESGDIDLGKVVRFAEIVVKDDAPGESPGSFEVRVFRGHGRQTADSFNHKVGAAGWPTRLVLPVGLTSRLDVEIRVLGRRFVRLDDVRGEVDVRLAPRVRVRVRLPEGMEPLEGGEWQLRAHLLPEEGKRYFIFPTDYAGTLGELEPEPALELPSVGMWSVSLSHGRTVVATATFELKDGAADDHVVTLEAR